MMTAEKVAYLKGLAEGLALGKETKEEKLIGAIIDVLEAVSGDMESLEGAICDMGDELDSVSDDLASVEEIVYDDLGGYCFNSDEDFEDEDECCCHHHDEEDGEEHECCHGHGHGHHHGEDHEGCCHHHGEGEAEESVGEEHECCHGHGSHRGWNRHRGGCCHGHHGPVLYEVTCPACENVLTIDEEILAKGSVQCPGCGGILEFQFPGDEETEE